MKPILIIAIAFLAACAKPAKTLKTEATQLKAVSKVSKRSCEGPNGTVEHGKRVLMYAELIVNPPKKCKRQYRVCTDGQLTGSFSFPGCTEVALYED